MPLSAAVLVLAALVAVTTVAGLTLRARAGRVRPAHPADALNARDLGVEGDLGHRATLVQLSTPACAVCPATARLLRRVADGHDGVRHVEVDLERRPDVAHRFAALQTPPPCSSTPTAACAPASAARRDRPRSRRRCRP